jgi:signal transduction histidine kinase
VKDAVRSFLAEPRVPDPPPRGWRDRALVVALVTAAILEGILREDLAWRAVAILLVAVPVLGLLWLRTNPLLVLAVGFGFHAAAELATTVGADGSLALAATAYVLLLPYAVFRWGSGRDAAIGLLFVAGHFLTTLATADVVEAVIGIPFLLLPAALGASMRYRASSKLRETDQVRLRERERLARELHDTVAHHVSAIAIQAQAGRAVAASRPDAAGEALEIIEQEASRTLAEMRAMVSVLRDGEAPDLAPQRGVADIQRLARSTGDGPHIDVELAGNLDGLRPLVDAAIYRLAQESITNALRHARNATRIIVRVAGDDDRVRLTVRDDGDASPFGAGSPSGGYGLVGMTERATLLGGTLDAGPSSGGGWTIAAVLPRNAAAT